jgi:glycopeptide antibiotics resistance protein
MENQLGLILKVLLFSTLLSLLIKYAAPYLAIAATDINALIMVLLPAVILAIVLLWRSQAVRE